MNWVYAHWTQRDILTFHIANLQFVYHCTNSDCAWNQSTNDRARDAVWSTSPPTILKLIVSAGHWSRSSSKPSSGNPWLDDARCRPPGAACRLSERWNGRVSFGQVRQVLLHGGQRATAGRTHRHWGSHWVGNQLASRLQMLTTHDRNIRNNSNVNTMPSWCVCFSDERKSRVREGYLH